MWKNRKKSEKKIEKFGLFIFVWACPYTSGRIYVVSFFPCKTLFLIEIWKIFSLTSGGPMWIQHSQQNVKILQMLLFLHYQFSLLLIIFMGQWINSQIPNVTSIILLWYFVLRCRSQISNYWNVALWRKVCFKMWLQFLFNDTDLANILYCKHYGYFRYSLVAFCSAILSFQAEWFLSHFCLLCCYSFFCSRWHPLIVTLVRRDNCWLFGFVFLIEPLLSLISISSAEP